MEKYSSSSSSSSTSLSSGLTDFFRWVLSRIRGGETPVLFFVLLAGLIPINNDGVNWRCIRGCMLGGKRGCVRRG